MGEDKKDGFIKERIKDKPLNKKKLAGRVLGAVLLGALFGIVSAASYAAGMYHLENTVYQRPVQEVVIHTGDEEDASDAVEDEAAPVELPVQETDSETETEPEKEPPTKDISEKAAIDVEAELTDLERYENAYDSLYEISQTAAKSLLPVYGVESGRDWFSDSVESKKRGSGLVIADNRRELLILVDRSIISGAQEIRVTLPDGTSASAFEKKTDPNFDLSIIGVALDDISDEAMEMIAPATLGTSSTSALTGKLVIAVGSPFGVSDSVSYGIITSASKLVPKQDTQVHMLTTDIYASSSGSGILVDLKGRTVGIITQDEADSSAKNLVSAYGISDLKSSIESMSNGQDRAYLGIYGIDVPKDATDTLGVPQGAYVTGIEADSPAMDCGMQSGDVVTMIGTNEIKNFWDFENVMHRSQPGDETVITVQRATRNTYTEMTFEVTLGVLK